ARAPTQAAALELYDRLRDAGYAARIHPTTAAERRLYLVQVSQLQSRADAEALREQLRGMAGVVDPKVSQ
ncbi:MAG TPA: SPOR domain-containing protein, partial [Burkholderiales bacterium]|nr:SPOR domain-containing protein [Burkholderiales bacterium]